MIRNRPVRPKRRWLKTLTSQFLFPVTAASWRRKFQRRIDPRMSIIGVQIRKVPKPLQYQLVKGSLAYKLLCGKRRERKRVIMARKRSGRDVEEKRKRKMKNTSWIKC